MKLGIGLTGMASRMARVRAEHAREQAIRAALDELARRAQANAVAAEPSPANDSARNQDIQPLRS